MKADISTLLKPDILTLQRQVIQGICCRITVVLRCASETLRHQARNFLRTPGVLSRAGS